MLEWIAAERAAARRKGGIGIENPQATSNHDKHCDDVHPVSDSNDPVMAADSHNYTIASVTVFVTADKKNAQKDSDV